MILDPDGRWMAHALRLGRRTLGGTGANPAVGCVIVRGGLLVGAGWTAEGGRPHAETQALAMAAERACGATAYVTLEPCAHHGRTPSCADALVAAGLGRVVTALRDPDPRTCGRGHERLREAGIEVITGVGAEEAAHDLAGYLSRRIRNRPYVTLKLAVSRDGMIAARAGAPTAITGRRAGARVHLLRAMSDAILIGVSTAVADDPLLTCRLPGLEHRSPVRVVSDSHLRLPLSGRLAATVRDVPVWVLSAGNGLPERARALEELGVEVIACSTTEDGKVDLGDALGKLAGRGINRTLAEGGAHMARALLEADLVDEVQLFTAPMDLGPGGVEALAGLPLAEITASRRFRFVAQEQLGEDVLTAYERAAA